MDTLATCVVLILGSKENQGKRIFPPRISHRDIQGVTTAVLLNLACSALYKQPILVLISSS